MITYTENLVNHHNHVEPTEVDLLREDVPGDSEKNELRFAFAYISAITTEQDRTYRIGIVGFCITFGMPVGVGLSGILLRLVGFYGVYLISISIHSLNALYSIFVLKDPKRSPEQKEHADRGCCHLMRTFFNFTNVKETICVIVRNAPNNRRLRLCVLLLVVTVIFGPMQGEMSIMYLSVRFRFQWDEIQYSIFQTYNLIINFIGTTFTILVLARHFGWHDSLLGIISSISKIAASFVYGFAQSGAIFYLGPVIDILNGTALLAMRAIMSKLVELEELGKLSSVVGIAENLMPLIYVPMYTRVYSATLDVLPGAVFLLGALLTLPVVAVLSNFFYEHRKQVGKLKSSPIELE
ncbi:unnamed protein product [Arctia plantaginis]|uniref:Solute carrier family 46 member 3 n=1 Tax=Arctia plantaginis TaxID=874455 RepID=A0A8S1AGG7_ARCPL|nr:unnamed protein product [Arctia plantaginis]